MATDPAVIVHSQEILCLLAASTELKLIEEVK